jgi:FMN phosphatase YigB (HAD superfamily)
VSLENARAIVFDLDGTLFDLTPVVQAARQRVATFLFSNGFFASRAYARQRINTLERKHGPYYSSSPYYFAFFDIAKAVFKDKPDRVRHFLDKQNTDPEAEPVAPLEKRSSVTSRRSTLGGPSMASAETTSGSSPVKWRIHDSG